MPLRILVLGGTGNVGARIVRALQGEVNIELLAASRRGTAVAGAEVVPAVALDTAAPDFPARLRACAPGLVIHCAGPFQGQGYHVAEATLAARAHYLDLADGRAFVVQFVQANQARAFAARRVAISGASTLPALSSAVIDALRERLRGIESVEIAIAPGHRAPRGAATVAAVLSYLGRPGPVWRDGAWTKAHGWMNLRSVPFAIGTRWAAMCDVPDLTLVPARYPGLRSASCHAALEFRLQHAVLWSLAALRRMGAPLPVVRWATRLDRGARLLDPFAGERGGMRVSVVGQNGLGQRVRRTWQLQVPARDGAEIPALAAIVLARRFAQDEWMKAGAYTGAGVLRLADFAADFARLGVHDPYRHHRAEPRLRPAPIVVPGQLSRLHSVNLLLDIDNTLMYFIYNGGYC